MNLEDIKIYLPKFLSAESEKELFEGLKKFPDNIDNRLYTNYLDDSKIIYQGDGIKDMLIFNISDKEIKPTPSVIFSNTCDIDLNNKRNFPSQIVYAPIFNLKKYEDALYKNSKKNKEQIYSHIESIKKQGVTQIFYLPQIKDKIDDSIVFLDRVFNCPNNYVERENISDRKIFTLSDYGAYLFLIKLSIHFTRIQDKVERKSVRI